MLSAEPRIIVFASGSGSLFLELVRCGDDLGYTVAGLVVSRLDCGAASLARDFSIPRFYSEDFFSSPDSFLDVEATSLFVLAGFTQKVPGDFVQRFEAKVINTHPSLLPKYGGRGMYGKRVHKAVLANHESLSGLTIHYVSENYDEGAIIYQHSVDVDPDETPDSLEQKIKLEEKKHLPRVVAQQIYG